MLLIVNFLAPNRLSRRHQLRCHTSTFTCRLPSSSPLKHCVFANKFRFSKASCPRQPDQMFVTQHSTFTIDERFISQLKRRKCWRSEMFAIQIAARLHGFPSRFYARLLLKSPTYITPTATVGRLSKESLKFIKNKT